MKELEKRIKELEIKEQTLKNKTYWISVLVPVLTVILSFVTSYFTIKSNFSLDQLNFTQDQITALFENADIVNNRKKLRFLINTGLIGEPENAQVYIQELNDELTDESRSAQYLLQGIEAFETALHMDKDEDSINYFYVKSIEKLHEALELNPNNLDAIGYLGNTYHNIGLDLNLGFFYEKALTLYDQALAQDSTIAYLKADKARIHFEINDTVNACDYALRALQAPYLDPARSIDMDMILSRYGCSKEH